MNNTIIRGALIGVAVVLMILFFHPVMLMVLAGALIGGLIGAHQSGRIDLVELGYRFIGRPRGRR